LDRLYADGILRAPDLDHFYTGIPYHATYQLDDTQIDDNLHCWLWVLMVAVYNGDPVILAAWSLFKENGRGFEFLDTLSRLHARRPVNVKMNNNNTDNGPLDDDDDIRELLRLISSLRESNVVNNDDANVLTQLCMLRDPVILAAYSQYADASSPEAEVTSSWSELWDTIVRLVAREKEQSSRDVIVTEASNNAAAPTATTANVASPLLDSERKRTSLRNGTQEWQVAEAISALAAEKLLGAADVRYLRQVLTHGNIAIDAAFSLYAEAASLVTPGRDGQEDAATAWTELRDTMLSVAASWRRSSDYHQLLWYIDQLKERLFITFDERDYLHELVINHDDVLLAAYQTWIDAGRYGDNGASQVGATRDVDLWDTISRILDKNTRRTFAQLKPIGNERLLSLRARGGLPRADLQYLEHLINRPTIQVVEGDAEEIGIPPEQLLCDELDQQTVYAAIATWVSAGDKDDGRDRDCADTLLRIASSWRNTCEPLIKVSSCSSIVISK
jgi:hypothetical protein